jgi:hypothetical protein
MNKHLTSDEMTDLLAGAANEPALERHVQECPACRLEFAHFRESMQRFRESVILAGDLARVNRAAAVGVPAPPARRVYLWPAVAVFAALVVLLPVYTITTQKYPESELRGVGRLSDDEVLLKNVETRLSRRVPSAFAPMMELMATDWDEVNSRQPIEEE